MISELDIPGMTSTQKGNWITFVWDPAHELELAVKDVRKEDIFQWLENQIKQINEATELLNMMITNLGLIFRLMGQVSKNLQTVELFPWEILEIQDGLIQNMRKMADIKLNAELSLIAQILKYTSFPYHYLFL